MQLLSMTWVEPGNDLAMSQARPPQPKSNL